MAFHISLFATRSLKAIDDWMSTCQANLSGSTRNAFKETTLMYGGGLINTVKDPTLTQNGKMFAEQALTTGNTRLNWDDGSIVTSTQDTHFAIQGEGFFLVSELNAAGAVPVSTYPNAAVKSFLTRDGEFHFSIVPGISATDAVLVNSQGLVVLSDLSDGVSNGNSDDILHEIRFSSFDNAAIKERPSVYVPTTDAAAGTAPISKIENDQLLYSKYGSTVFDIPSQTTFVKTVVNGSAKNLYGRDLSTVGDSKLEERSLESANVDVAHNITDMAALGKAYNGFVQLIKVYNASLDEVLGFIR